MLPVVALFLIIAALYASVGFGGGSSYTAVLMITDTDFRLVPVISLICNLIVVSGGTIYFARAGLLRANIVLPFTVLSVPMAWLGGITPIDKGSFTLVLSLVLLGSAVAMLINRPVDPDRNAERVNEAALDARTHGRKRAGLYCGSDRNRRRYFSRAGSAPDTSGTGRSDRRGRQFFHSGQLVRRADRTVVETRSAGNSQRP